MIIALVLLIGSGVLCGAGLTLVDAVRERRRKPLWRSIVRIAGAFLVVYGTVGFFGAALSATGGLRWLPRTVQLPMGWADGAVTDREGNIYCPSSPFGRIQVYGRDLRFLHGWFVDASGGSFRIRVSPADRLEVVTARGRVHYEFDLHGNQISRSTYAPKSYSDFEHWKGERVFLPNPAVLLPWSNPLGSVGVALLGIVMLKLTDSRKKRSPRPRPTPDEDPSRTKVGSDAT